MENEHVLGGLTRKRAEIAGQIEHTHQTLRKLVGELDAIDAAIRIFDPTADEPPMTAARSLRRYEKRSSRAAGSPPVTPPPGTRSLAPTALTARGPAATN